MRALSSAGTRLWRLPAEKRSPGAAAGTDAGGINPLTACRLRPGIASAPISSKESIFSPRLLVPARGHWQDPHSGSSILQSLISGSPDGRGEAPLAADIPPPAGTAFS